jgi:hypothetical protein
VCGAAVLGAAPGLHKRQRHNHTSTVQETTT